MINENWIYLGTAIGALGALVYLRDTLRGTTKPNRVTWLLWAFAPLLAAGVEFHGGVGLRALPTFMVGFMPLLIFIASFHNSASVWQIRRIDYACGAMSVVGTIVWFATQNGVLAISAAIAADFLAGVPTLMKSWTHPETETIHSYIGAVISMGIVLLTITQLDLRGGRLCHLHRHRRDGRGRPDRARARAAPAPGPPPGRGRRSNPVGLSSPTRNAGACTGAGAPAAW